MLLARNITNNFVSIRQPYFGDFPHSGVRFFGRCCIYTGTDTTFLWTLFQVLRLRPFNFRLPRFADQLLYCWHSKYPVNFNLLSHSEHRAVTVCTPRPQCKKPQSSKNYKTTRQLIRGSKQKLGSCPLQFWSYIEATLNGCSRAYRRIRFRCQHALSIENY